MKRLLLTLTIFLILLGASLQVPGYAVLVMPVGNLEIHLGVGAWILLVCFWLVWFLTRLFCKMRTI